MPLSLGQRYSEKLTHNIVQDGLASHRGRPEPIRLGPTRRPTSVVCGGGAKHPTGVATRRIFAPHGLSVVWFSA